MPKIIVSCTAQEERCPWLELSPPHPWHPQCQNDKCLDRLQTKVRRCAYYMQHLRVEELSPQGGLITHWVPRSWKKWCAQQCHIRPSNYQARQRACRSWSQDLKESRPEPMQSQRTRPVWNWTMWNWASPSRASLGSLHCCNQEQDQFEGMSWHSRPKSYRKLVGST